MRINVLCEAAEDLRFLLSRGYNRETVLKTIGDRYQLDKVERHIIYRAVYPDSIVEQVVKKTVTISQLPDKELAIDGFNQLITLESILKGEIIILCDDGFIRDVSAVFEKFKATETTFKALNLIFKALSANPPKKTYFYLDSPISKSGKLAALITDYFEKYGVTGEAAAIKNVDEELVSKDVVASSDHIIISRARQVIDLPKLFLNLYTSQVISFK
ncbi:MAG: DUF434 domain-containing protein [Candidatus Odinarchaeum yellowstonii]|uniref:DUF434 domain-containing protein n=1 Tax=Odinarchaeota yellowstonii (strain LCB_4) TaxID=1841599 RepID=A0AAF0D3K1_ODILC|nr:MAG: DUF434 domain-containing protein [Candidatus Odinarchaeum yellowstonii]